MEHQDLKHETEAQRQKQFNSTMSKEVNMASQYHSQARYKEEHRRAERERLAAERQRLDLQVEQSREAEI